MIGATRHDDAALLAVLRPMVVDAGAAVYAAQIDAMLRRPDAVGVLPLIDCPTLVVVGRDDGWSPVAQHEAIASAIPGARLRILDDAGHMAPVEDPDGFHTILRDWLSWPTVRPA